MTSLMSTEENWHHIPHQHRKSLFLSLASVSLPGLKCEGRRNCLKTYMKSHQNQFYTMCVRMYKNVCVTVSTYACVRYCKKRIKCYWLSWTFYRCSYESSMNRQPVTPLSICWSKNDPSEWLRAFLSQLKLEKPQWVLIFTTLQVIVVKENADFIFNCCSMISIWKRGIRVFSLACCANIF